jgi:serine/threonine-protein phosphatase 2A regulatory subunit B''
MNTVDYLNFKSHLSSLPPTSPSSNNIRYTLAKKKIDELFIKWMSLPQTIDAVKKYMQEVKTKPQNILNQNLNPLLTFQKLNLQNSTLMNSTIKNAPFTPPKSPCDINKKKLNQTSSDIFESPTNLSPRKFEFEDKEKDVKEKVKKKDDTFQQIPQFYFPPGKSLDQIISDDTMKEINEIFAVNKDELDAKVCEQLTARIFKIPKFLHTLVFSKIDKDKRLKITKQDFLRIWKTDFAHLEPAMRCFNVLKKSTVDYIDIGDLKPLLQILLLSHPGLEFLKNTPEFQERYGDTVVQRILYKVDSNDDGRIGKREFKKSNLFKALEHVDAEEDINKVREYFSYEHFYVLYCKYWELDSDHDFFISKEDFSRYSSHALSKKCVERIFQEIPRKFKSKVPGKMSYEDFIWFTLSEEDKTTDTSIEYWFKVLDLDSNDIITGYEMEYFYEEQKQRLDYLNHEPVLFEDILCQMADLFKPEKEIHFRIENFKKQRQMAGVFFNFLTNLNKFVNYEGRDPFQIKNEITENPDFSEWDRFAQREYIRLALEEENAENSGMLDSADLWDGDENAPEQPKNLKGG